MAINQQTIADPRTLLAPPGAGWKEIYSKGYSPVFEEPAGTQVTATGLEFYGVDLGSFQLLGPNQVAGYAPQIDAVVQNLLGQRSSALYGAKLFWTVQASVALPVIGIVAVDRYRYVFAHRAVS